MSQSSDGHWCEWPLSSKARARVRFAGRTLRTPPRNGLDPTEKVAVNYFLGMNRPGFFRELRV